MKSVTMVRSRNVSNYFYYRVQPEGLLYDAERDTISLKIMVTLVYKTKATKPRPRPVFVGLRLCFCLRPHHW